MRFLLSCILLILTASSARAQYADEPPRFDPPAAAPTTLELPESKGLTLTLPERGDRNADPPQSGLPGIASVLGSLAIVLGLLLLVAWLLKRTMPAGSMALPSNVVEVLGKTVLAPRQNVHLVRIGNKLLLVAVSSAGAETLTEISDPIEVDRLAGLCMQSQPHSSSQAFRTVFQQFSKPAADSFAATRRAPTSRALEESDV